jgi:hypothetical protein
MLWEFEDYVEAAHMMPVGTRVFHAGRTRDQGYANEIHTMRPDLSLACRAIWLWAVEGPHPYS